jgi:hypothetical protein
MADREYLTQLGTPAVDKAFNGLRTITRLYNVNGQGTQQANIETKVFLAYGTADAEFTTALLVKRGMDQVAATPSAWVLRLTEVYQEFTAGSKVSVGEDQHFKLEDGRYGFVRRYVALASEAEGLAAAIGDVISSQACNDVKINKQGVGAEIVETYISAGQLSQSDSTQNNGALLIRTLVHFNEVPSTPVGYTLVDQDVKGPLGVETYTYRFAKGNGEISRRTDRSQGGTTEDGSVGISRLDIDYLTAPGAAEPTWGSVAGYVKIAVTNAERDGHELWSAVFAKGTGTVLQSDDTQNNGALLLRTITALGTAPSTPVGYTLTREQTRQESGHVVYAYSFAKGDGQISRDDDTRNNGALLLATITHLTAPGAADPVATLLGYVRTSISNQERDGHEVWRAVFAKGTGQISYDPSSDNNGALLRIAIRHLTAPSATNPISTPAGYTLVGGPSYQEADGHMIWSASYAKGDGEISRDIDYSQSDDQGTTGITRTTIRHLVAPAAAVQPASLLGSVEIGRTYQDADGHRIWTTVWAKGVGQVLDESQISASGALVIYHRIKLGSAPTTPTATIGGTVTLFDSSVRLTEGFSVYDYRWAEGDGQAGIETRGEPDGALLYHVTDYNVAATTPAYPGTGTAYLISLEQRPHSGYYVNTAVYKKPPATQTRRQTIPWHRPGLASFTSNQLTLLPPTQMTLLASVEVSYSATQDTTAPYGVSYYAGLIETWVPTDTGIAQTRQSALGGYLGDATSISGSASNYNGVLCDTWSAVITSSSPTSRPSAETKLLHVDNEPYLTATDGTVIYRITKTSYTFP